jgi:hypothetical protein
MTADEFGTVDIDLLADYIGDALDDGERAWVARLIAEDPQWRSAHAVLAPGMSQVGAQLSALGTASEPMPADLGVRLDAAFAADPASGHGLIAAELTEPGEPHLQPSRGDRHLVSVPTGSEAKVAPRRRRLRWAAPIAAAAGVLAFAGFGTAYLTSRDDVAQNSTAGGAADSAAAAPMSAPESALVSALSDDQIMATGANYTADTLKTEPAATTMGAQGDTDSQKRPAAEPGSARLQTPSGLTRLRDRTALLACLQAIAQQNAAGPIAVQTVDYASYAGAPALIVRFSAAGRNWAWATGPDCGSPGRGAQARQTVQVG